MSKRSNSMSKTHSDATGDSTSSLSSQASNDSKKTRLSSDDSPRRVGPLLHLYRDVLHSIAAFLSLRDVSVMARTHKQWLADVPLMPVRRDYGHVHINSIETLRQALESRFAKHVTHVSVDNSDTNRTQKTELIRIVRSNRSITSLGVWIDGLDEPTAVALADALAHNNTLRTLLLPPSIDQIVAILAVEALVFNTTLTALTLTDYRFDEHRHIERLASALAKNRALQSLDMSGMNMSPRDLVEVARIMLAHPTLTSINLLGDSTEHTCPIELVEAVRDNPARALHVVDFGFVQLGKSHVDVLAQVIRDPMCVLTRIDLGSTGLDDASANVLVDALRVNRTVTHVNVSGNQDMSDAGGVAFAALLAINTTITALFICSIGAGKPTVDAFVRVIAQTKTLQSLDLSGHLAIDDVVAFALAHSLATNRSLITVSFRQTGIEVLGARALAAMLTVNQTLQRLDLRYNDKFPADSVLSLDAANARRVVRYDQYGTRGSHENAAS